MTDNDLKKLLQEKLSLHELNVPANGWSSIEKRLPIVPLRTQTLWRWSAGIGVAAMLLLGVILFNLPSNSVPTGEHLAESQTLQQTSTIHFVETNPGFTNPEVALLTKVEKKEKLTQKSEKKKEKTGDKSSKKQTKSKGKTTKEEDDSNGSKEREKLESTPQDNQNQAPTWHEQDDDASEYIAQKEIPIAPNENSVFVTSEPRSLSIEEAELVMREQANRQIASVDEQTNRVMSSESNNWTVGLLASLTPDLPNMTTTPKTILMDNTFSYRSLLRTNAKHDLPIMVGLSVGIPLAKRLSLQTGLNYAYIHSLIIQSNLGTGNRTEDNQKLHYLGIPVMLSYRIVDHKIVKFYVSGGGMGEKGLVRDVTTRYFENYDILWDTDSKQESIKGVQWSLTANIGVGVNLYKGLHLYFEPGFTWYIPNTHAPQPDNLRTEHLYNLSLTAGLRYNFEK